MSVGVSRVVVAGAGVVGAACARALALEGIEVVVVDPGPLGGGATAASMGHLVVMDDSDPQLALTSHSVAVWKDLASVLPDDVEFDRCGTLWVAADDNELEEVRRKERTLRDHGVACEILDATALAESEPRLRAGLAGGLRVPGDVVVYPPCLVRWLVGEAQRRGAHLRLGARVVEWTGQEAKLDDGSRIGADALIGATGALAARWAPGLPVRPRKGHLVITDRYPGFLRHQVLELGYLRSAHGAATESVAFNVQPRATGQLLIGSSRQFGVDTPDVDAGIVGRMLRRALEYLPDLATVSAIRTWTGFRAATPDGLPIVGPHPRVPGLCLATGHEGLGITTAPGTAELVVHHLTGRSVGLPTDPFLPARFEEMARCE